MRFRTSIAEALADDGAAAAARIVLKLYATVSETKVTLC
jgi:hypothetical protein